MDIKPVDGTPHWVNRIYEMIHGLYGELTVTRDRVLNEVAEISRSCFSLIHSTASRADIKSDYIITTVSKIAARQQEQSKFLEQEMKELQDNQYILLSRLEEVKQLCSLALDRITDIENVCYSTEDELDKQTGE